MATASDARAWARAGLRGIGNSLYTPFSGIDGDEIDWGAYRTLVRYCVGGLGHEMLWCTSGIAEFWALTLDERKRLLEVAIEEGRKADPDVVVQACTAATSAKDCVELTRHAQQAGADIDLDGMVTQAAPLSALVQRLGRVNRMGSRPAAPARPGRDPRARRRRPGLGWRGVGHLRRGHGDAVNTPSPAAHVPPDGIITSMRAADATSPRYPMFAAAALT